MVSAWLQSISINAVIVPVTLQALGPVLPYSQDISCGEKFFLFCQKLQQHNLDFLS